VVSHLEMVQSVDLTHDQQILTDMDWWSTGWSTPGPRGGPRRGPTPTAMASHDRPPTRATESTASTKAQAADYHGRADSGGTKANCGSSRLEAPAHRDIHQDHSSRRYRERAGRRVGDEPGEVAVVTPVEPPALDPAAAKTLLRILIKASTPRRAEQ